MRQCLGEGVAPVYFIELPGLDTAAVPGPNVEQGIAAAVDEFRKRQWCDLRPWHLAGKRAVEDAEVARRLKTLKEQLAERLSRADRTRQSPTNLYRHNSQFVGRVRELTLLREAVKERGSVGVVSHKSPGGPAAAVHGVGGMGRPNWRSLMPTPSAGITPAAAGWRGAKISTRSIRCFTSSPSRWA